MPACVFGVFWLLINSKSLAVNSVGTTQIERLPMQKLTEPHALIYYSTQRRPALHGTGTEEKKTDKSAKNSQKRPKIFKIRFKSEQ